MAITFHSNQFYAKPYNQMKAFYPLDYLQEYKKIPINRVDDHKGDTEMLKKLIKNQKSNNQNQNQNQNSL